MDFSTKPDRRGTHSVKWDSMESLYGVSPDDGIAMWVADSEFKPPQGVVDAVQRMVDHGVFGYFGNDGPYKDAVQWWMKERHGWDMDPAHMFTTGGLVNAVGLCLQAYTQPDDGVVIFTPVYHAFARTIKAAGRRVVECPLAQDNGRYVYDWDAYNAQMDGSEKMMILCSPHNPGGRVWTREELETVAEFAKRHDLVLVSDEIHHDLVFDGFKHIPMTALDVDERLVMLTAPSKTFNIAGGHCGQVTIADEALRKKFAFAYGAVGTSPNAFGLHMTTAAYTSEGAAWTDAWVKHLDGNRKAFDAGIAEIPGLVSMDLESTYLAWVDFSGTGMARQEFSDRVMKGAKIAANYGTTFGKGGEQFLRFNLGTTRVEVEEAVTRLKGAFADLQ